MEPNKEASATAAQTQEKIALAALALFAEKGYFNTSLTDIAKAAGLKSTHAVYHCFANKHMIAAHLYGNIVDNLGASIDDIRRRQHSASSQLRDVVDLLFKLTDEAPAVMRFLLLLRVEEFLPEQKRLHESHAFVKIHKIIQHGIRNGEIRSLDPQLVNGYFFGVVNNTLRMVLEGALDKKADAYLAQTWLMAWNTIAKRATPF